MSLFEVEDLEALKSAIAAGANVNEVDYRGRSIVCYAAYVGQLDYAVALINANADVNKADEDGYTPLHNASLGGHVECVRLLIQHKANVNALDNLKRLPLHLASLSSNLQCVQILVTSGASRNIDMVNRYGATPIVDAIRMDNDKVAEFLLHSGAKMIGVTEMLGSDMPSWLQQLISRRHNVMSSTLTLKGMLKRRCGLPKDVTNLLGLCVWRTRLNSIWSKY
jgi:ankyrin repeat protein